MTDKTASSAEDTKPRFETDRGASRSFWIACALLVAIIGWMASGFLGADAEEPQQAASNAPAPPAVVVRASTAETVQLSFSAQGQALPERDSQILTEAAGTIVSLPVEKGQRVAQGTVIVQFDTSRTDANLAQATEEQSRAERELSNAQTLLDRGAATVDRVAQARANLAAAEAQVSAAEEALANYTILAPFDGTIEDLMLNDGEYAGAGVPVARIVDSDPITVSIQIPQQSRAQIEVGQSAEVAFVTGETRQGTVGFVASAASPDTRTFLAEISVENADGSLRPGVSAEVTIPTREETAHFVEASVVSLSPEGATGIKTVEDGVVMFHRIEIVTAEVGGLWATGLPETADIITIGQGFVRDGEPVRVQTEAERDAVAGEQNAEAQVDSDQ